MKNMRLSTVYASLLFFLFALLQMPLWAQDNPTAPDNTKTTTTETTTTTTTWYLEPWVWVVGGALLLLIIVALVRSGSGRDTEVSRTTIIKE